MPASKAASVHARVWSNSTPPEYVSHEPREISETSRSEEPSLRYLMPGTVRNARRPPLPATAASASSPGPGLAGDGERDVLARRVVAGHVADELVLAGRQRGAERLALAAAEDLALGEDRVVVEHAALELGGGLDDPHAVPRGALVADGEGDLAGLDLRHVALDPHVAERDADVRPGRRGRLGRRGGGLGHRRAARAQDTDRSAGHVREGVGDEG